jgi:hypothetical protein
MVGTNTLSTLPRFVSVWVYTHPVTYLKMTKKEKDLHNYVDTCV